MNRADTRREQLRIRPYQFGYQHLYRTDPASRPGSAPDRWLLQARQLVETFSPSTQLLHIAVLSFLFLFATPVAGQRPPDPQPELPRPGAVGPRAAKVNPKGLFRENVTLPVDSNLLKRFGTVKELLDDQRWADAIAILQEIAQTESRSLVLVQPGKVGGVATYLNVATRCSVLLSRIPPEGRAAYRQKVDPQAKRWLENWQRTRDESELLRIVRQTFMSRFADDALLALGEVAWDRGDFSAARSWWEQLIPLTAEADPAMYPTVLRYPDSELDRPSVHARILLCSIMEREFDRAVDDLGRFAEQFPRAEGRIGGQSGVLADLLRQTLDEARNWVPQQTSAEVATFGLSPERYQRIPESVDVGALRWVRPLSANVLPNQQERFPFQYEALCYHPVVFDNASEKIVLVNDADAIRAWNLLTGEPAWKSEHADPAVIYPTLPTNRRSCRK